MDENKDIKNEENGELEPELLVLTDEDGVEHSFELVDTLEKNDKSYVALIAAPETPEEAIDDDGNLVIMKIIEDEGGEEILELIEDDDEFEEISEIFMDRLSDLYEFEEEDAEDDE